MKLLITGAKGYVGQALLRQLGQENILCYAADMGEFDLADLNSIRAFFIGKGITHVIHLAGAVETNDAVSLFNANIAGLYNLLLICAEENIQYFELASTNVVYGSGKEAACRETDSCRPDFQNLYAVSKYCGEAIAADFCARHGIAYTAVRIGDIYGPGQKVGKLIKAVVHGAAASEPLTLYGEGVRMRDYIYIDDVARGLLFICRSGLTGPINLATGVGTSVAQLVDIGVELSGGVCKVRHIEVEHEDISRIVLDVHTLRNAGFAAEISIKEGLKKCVLWQQEMERRKNEGT